MGRNLNLLTEGKFGHRSVWKSVAHIQPSIRVLRSTSVHQRSRFLPSSSSSSSLNLSSSYLSSALSPSQPSHFSFSSEFRLRTPRTCAKKNSKKKKKIKNCNFYWQLNCSFAENTRKKEKKERRIGGVWWLWLTPEKMAVISVLGEEFRSQPVVAGSSRSAFRTDRRDSFVVKSEPSSLTFNAADADDDGSLSLPQHFFFLFFCSTLQNLGRVWKFRNACFFCPIDFSDQNNIFLGFFFFNPLIS